MGKRASMVFGAVLILMNFTGCLPLEAPALQPIYSATMGSTSISLEEDGAITQKFLIPRCSLESGERDEIVVTSRYGGTRKEQGGSLLSLFVELLKLIPALFAL